MAKVRRCLAGADLVDERLGETVALLSLVPRSDAISRKFTDEKSTWATVTPVILPGYDDPDHLRIKLRSNALTSGEQACLVNKLAARIDSLLRKALVQAGFSATIAKHVELDWRSVGFLPGVEQASRYGVPSHLKRFPRVHVKLRFRTPTGDVLNVGGPVCIGGGRFSGAGLFVGVSET